MLSFNTKTLSALLLFAGAFCHGDAHAQLQFTCTVEKTSDGTTFVAMGRKLACPLSVQYSLNDSDKEYTMASSCIINAKNLSCRGVVDLPAKARVQSVSTGPSLLNDEEITTGATPASKDMPLTQLSGDKKTATIKHQYFFASPSNNYYNRTTPCDVDGDNRVSPLDMLALNEFRRKNRWTVDLIKYEQGNEAVAFVDPTNDWISDWRDEQRILGCLNKR
jgi:hypothetical protein